MIRGILHLLNDQPLVVELFEAPKPSDLSIICTSVRTLDGKRPVFIDYSSSTFVFPMSMVRFLEIPSEDSEAERARTSTAAQRDEDESDDLDIDEDFLRRVREA